MKAILLTGFGGTDMLRYGDAPDPVAGSGDVVIDVYAASVNAADSKVRRGAVWPPEITRYKLADAAEAHRVSEGRHLRGKLVLEVR